MQLYALRVLMRPRDPDLFSKGTVQEGANKSLI